jgi:hypothetical protein
MLLLILILELFLLSVRLVITPFSTHRYYQLLMSMQGHRWHSKP